MCTAKYQNYLPAKSEKEKREKKKKNHDLLSTPVGGAAMFHEIIISIKKIYRLISVKLRLKDSICIINWHSFGIAIASNECYCSTCYFALVCDMHIHDSLGVDSRIGLFIHRVLSILLFRPFSFAIYSF